MKNLLDTHAFLWFFTGDRKLSAHARSEMEDPANDNFVSIASLWEIAIKSSLGKLTLDDSFDRIIPQVLAEVACGLLSVELDHVNQLATLPFHHRDPFDRMLVAQSTLEQMPVISADASFDAYGVT